MVHTLLGKKIEMAQVFKDDGTVVPVTLLEVGPCTITQIKTTDTDGYYAVQLGFGKKSKKGGEKPRFLREARMNSEEEVQKCKVGKEIKAHEVFKPGDLVSVTGTSKGKGFAGAIKRWGFRTQPKTHGQGTWHRAPGSIGAEGVGKVFKGKKMAGRMGGKRVTVKGLEVVEVNEEKNVLKVKGAVPGNSGGFVIVRNMSEK